MGLHLGYRDAQLIQQTGGKLPEAGTHVLYKLDLLSSPEHLFGNIDTHNAEIGICGFTAKFRYIRLWIHYFDVKSCWRRVHKAADIILQWVDVEYLVGHKHVPFLSCLSTSARRSEREERDPRVAWNFCRSRYKTISSPPRSGRRAGG